MVSRHCAEEGFIKTCVRLDAARYGALPEACTARQRPFGSQEKWAGSMSLHMHSIDETGKVYSLTLRNLVDPHQGNKINNLPAYGSASSFWNCKNSLFWNGDLSWCVFLWSLNYRACFHDRNCRIKPDFAAGMGRFEEVHGMMWPKTVLV